MNELIILCKEHSLIHLIESFNNIKTNYDLSICLPIWIESVKRKIAHGKEKE